MYDSIVVLFVQLGDLISWKVLGSNIDRYRMPLGMEMKEELFEMEENSELEASSMHTQKQRTDQNIFDQLAENEIVMMPFELSDKENDAIDHSAKKDKGSVVNVGEKLQAEEAAKQCLQLRSDVYGSGEEVTADVKKLGLQDKVFRNGHQNGDDNSRTEVVNHPTAAMEEVEEMEPVPSATNKAGQVENSDDTVEEPPKEKDKRKAAEMEFKEKSVRVAANEPVKKDKVDADGLNETTVFRTETEPDATKEAEVIIIADSGEEIQSASDGGGSEEIRRREKRKAAPVFTIPAKRVYRVRSDLRRSADGPNTPVILEARSESDARRADRDEDDVRKIRGTSPPLLPTSSYRLAKKPLENTVRVLQKTDKEKNRNLFVRRFDHSADRQRRLSQPIFREEDLNFDAFDLPTMVPSTSQRMRIFSEPEKRPRQTFARYGGYSMERQRRSLPTKYEEEELLDFDNSSDYVSSSGGVTYLMENSANQIKSLVDQFKRFERRVMKDLNDLKREFYGIRQALSPLISQKTADMQLPTPLPLFSEEAFMDLEDFLREDEYNIDCLASYISSCGGKSVNDFTRRVINRLMCPMLTRTFSLKGRKGKRCFSDSPVCAVVMKAVMTHSAAVTEVDVEESLKSVFKHI